MSRSDLTTFMYRLSCNLGASTSWNPQGLSRPVQGLLLLLYHAARNKCDRSWRHGQVQMSQHYGPTVNADCNHRIIPQHNIRIACISVYWTAFYQLNFSCGTKLFWRVFQEELRKTIKTQTVSGPWSGNFTKCLANAGHYTVRLRNIQ
jgi:hypothetical protein